MNNSKLSKLQNKMHPLIRTIYLSLIRIDVAIKITLRLIAGNLPILLFHTIHKICQRNIVGFRNNRRLSLASKPRKDEIPPF